MPLISASDYVAPRLFQSGHVQTVVPKLFRRVDAPPYRRERLDTPDGDFLDLDWMQPILIVHCSEVSRSRDNHCAWVRGSMTFHASTE